MTRRGDTAKQQPSAPGNILRRNALANFVGRFWNALLSVVFVPVYIRLMGAESYGLVGFFVTLQMILSLMELGLATTATKEVARLSAEKPHAPSGPARDLIRTLEVVYLLMAAAAALIVFAGAEKLAGEWFQARSVSKIRIEHAIVMMGVLIAVRMPFSLYSGALMGLQRHVAVNGILVVMATARHAGAVVALMTVSSDVIVFFAWNLVVETAQTAASGYFFWKTGHPPETGARFRFEQIKGIWRFATGMSLVGATNVALSQADKLFVSKVYSLERFGYYSAMWTIAGALFFLTYPIITALFPRYAQLFGKEARPELIGLYRKSGRILAALMLPAGMTFLFFAETILSIWLPMAGELDRLAFTFRILVAGVMLNCLFNLPLNIQLAAGWTRPMISTNMTWLLLLPLCMWGLSRAMGLPGVPLGWLLYNLFCVTVLVRVIHRRLLKGVRFYDFLKDMASPLVASCCVAGLCRLMLPLPAGTAGKCFVLGGCALLAGAGSLMTLHDVRVSLFDRMDRWRK